MKKITYQLQFFGTTTHDWFDFGEPRESLDDVMALRDLVYKEAARINKSRIVEITTTTKEKVLKV